MKIQNKTYSFQTKEELDFIDVTDQVKDFITKSGLKNGLCNIQTLHTTTAILVNENEPLLISDIKSHLRNIVPRDIKYKHDDFKIRTVNLCDDECKNGHAHCKAIHLPTSLTLNILNGELQLGQWQRIFFIELDHSRPRKMQVLVIGE